MSYFANSNFRTRLRPNPGRWLSVDLHVHSAYSGGSLAPAELLVLAGSQLLDGIAIADHHQVKGVGDGELFAAAHPGCPLVIPAQEISLGDHFHLLVIGGRDAWSDDNRRLLPEKVKNHHDNGGAVILAHPWTVPKTGWAAGCLRELLQEKILDGIELFNASLLEFPAGEALLKSAWENLVIPNRLAIVGGSDFHYHRQGRRLGAGRTYLKVYLPGIPGILEALRNRRAVAGLFSYRYFDLGDWGTGRNVLLGNGPWYGEFTGMIANLKKKIDRFAKGNPDKQQALHRLMAEGYYQNAWDLAEG